MRLNKMVFSLTLLVLFSLITLSTTAGTPPREYGVEMITAHRGSSFSAPENTVRAILLAMEHKAGIVEIDVRMTADGQIVLSHDDSMSRTAGVPLSVSQTSYEDLRQLDVGAWFGGRFAGETIPTLADILELTWDRIKLNIEIKMDNAPARLPAAVAELVLQHDAAERVIITSFDMAAIYEVKQVSERLQTGLIIGTMKQLRPDHFQNPHIDALSVRSSLVNRNVVERAKLYNKKLFVWTVNRAEEMRKMAGYGVDSIITDRPDLLFRVLF